MSWIESVTGVGGSEELPNFDSSNKMGSMGSTSYTIDISKGGFIMCVQSQAYWNSNEGWNNTSTYLVKNKTLYPIVDGIGCTATISGNNLTITRGQTFSLHYCPFE